MSAVLILVALVAVGVLFGYRPLATSERWRATLIPLASIMGSGFLVSAPLLAASVGAYAVLAMASLLGLAFAVGEAIRYNIRAFEPIEAHARGLPHQLEEFGQLVLVGAYFVSVTYYVQLLAAFALHAVGVDGASAASLLATCVLSLVGLVGVLWGLDSLSKLEKYAVGLDLGMIAALLVGLALHNVGLFLDGSWQLPDIPVHADLQTGRTLLGLLIVVQGFETSRYIGASFPAELRITTMRDAQLIASVIYVLFLAGSTVLFDPSMDAEVTAVLTMVTPIAAVLPGMLTVAALGSQFSAAVADDAGAGGLLGDLSGGRLSPRLAYGLIWAITVGLTWATDVNGIIAWASRAFALFYAVQCTVAAATARHHDRMGRAAWYLLLAAVCVLVCFFGTGAE